MVKIYEVAYSEHTVHHKRFEAASQKEAIDMAFKDVEKHFWDVSKAKGWEHGSGEGGHFEVIDELDKDEDDDLDDEDEDEEEEDAVRD
jgi:phosphoribosyl-AMP cyclohydrolase